MSCDIHQRLYDSGIMRHIAAALNKLPLPYRSMVVRVMGNRMAGHTMDRYVALWFWKTRLLEYEVIGLLSQLCAPGMKILDIGANVGLYTLLFAQHTGSSGTVWAFEPDLGNADMLKHNLRLNAYENVVVDTRAVGSMSKKGKLFLSESHQGDHRLFQAEDARESIEVDVVAIDDIFQNGECIDIVKIDVQGAEELVLAGMQQLISRSENLTIIVEIVEDEMAAPGCSAASAVVMLESLGFRLAYVDTKRSGIIPLNSADEFLQALDGKQYLNLLATKNSQICWADITR